MGTELFVAFDDLGEKPNRTLTDIYDLSQDGDQFGIKVNLDSLLDPPGDSLRSWMRTLQRLCKRRFADLKMWNGKRTMAAIASEFADLEVDFINVYAMADRQLEKAVRAVEGSKTKILGLTVLSHYDDAYCQKWFGRNLLTAVKDFSWYALEAGCHGIILPGTALDAVKHLDTIKVATGVRPAWYQDERHEQQATPAEVAKNGATIAVCGSPILSQPTVRVRIQALQKVLAELQATS